MITKFYGKNIPLQKLRELSETTREGSSLRGISEAAERIGFRSFAAKLDFKKLKSEAPLPCIVHWDQNHFVVIYKIKKDHVYLADPGFGHLKISINEFLSHWIGKQAKEDAEGMVLLLEPMPDFKTEDLETTSERREFSFLINYFTKYKKLLFQLLVGLIAGSFIQLSFPFLTQSLIDIGIQDQNLNFIYLILFAQLFLFLGKISLEVIRGWILLHLSARINISLISDFFIKLMRLPISFFDTKVTGDIIQRIHDHQRIQALLTSTSLTSMFSLVNIIVFGAILWWYNFSIFLLFTVGSTLYVLYIFLFLKKREELDYKMFSQTSQEQDKVIELVNGMQEIKLHNAERHKRWSWEYIQARIFRIQLKVLATEQKQVVGSGVINEAKNILITFLAAKLVIDGQLTLGMMLAISYIIGQLNYPLLNLVDFVQTFQDAKIAFARLAEIHNKEEEERGNDITDEIPEDQDLHLKNVSFKYKGAPHHVLKNFNFIIPVNKVTAIVGASGSGKTTLMKLLLKFYEPTVGEVLLGNCNLKNFAQSKWRDACGVVMQEGFIFNDTIANNIAVGDDTVDKKKLLRAVQMANIQDFISSLPLGYNTNIGVSGLNLSTGEKQRILIARALYKNPKYLFFDEATSALDTENERTIMENLNNFFESRTSVVIAHRLSTVKNAHQIVVLDKGEVVEIGDHYSLVSQKGIYYNLVKNQLELEQVYQT